ncbi:MAG: hypothetical protein GYB65_16425 [Chloroflexi bacterium]|nr:hypothetical protein [Chloroflexota bacterium]
MQAAIEDTERDTGEALDPALRVQVLLTLADHLAGQDQDAVLPSLQQQVLDAVHNIGDPASRVRALGALIEKMPPQLQHQAVSEAFDTAARLIPNELARATALSELPAHLPPEFHVQLLRIGEDLAMPDARALLLGRMLPYLAEPHRLRALSGALGAIEQIAGDEGTTRALIALAPHVYAVGSLQNIPEALQQVISVTFSIERSDDRARAFAALAPYLSPELLSEALQAVKGIADEHQRAATLAKLAPHLPGDLNVAAYAVAQELYSPEARATALSMIAPYLSATARARALADALAAAVAIQARYERVLALVDLAPHLRDDLQLRALREALTASRSIRDEEERGRALVFLAPHLPAQWLPDALADAYTIRAPLRRAPVLSALMPHLPPEPRLRVAQDVIERVEYVERAQDRASVLAAIAPVIPDTLLDDAVAAAEKIDTPYDRVHVLTALLPRLPEPLHTSALVTATAVPEGYQRVNALLELVPHFPPVQRYAILEQALDTALEMTDDYDRASALAYLASCIDPQADMRNRQQDALRLALDACLEETDSQARAGLLVRLGQSLVRLLTPAQCYPLWREVVDFLRHQPYTAMLSDLAALMPTIEHMGAAGAGDELAQVLLRLLEEE